MGKLALNYSISILEQNVDNFLAHDYSIYNNSRINLEVLELSISYMGFFDWFYLDHSLQGSWKKYKVMEWNRR
jgi:hypothetical protein